MPRDPAGDQADAIHADRIVRVATTVILGAGDLGGALARQLAAADVVSTVVLVDEAGSVAQGKALDIRQASPVDRYSTRRERNHQTSTKSSART